MPVCVPISYIGEDSEHNCIEQGIGVTQDISQTGIQIETIYKIQSEFIVLMFVGLEKESIEVRGEVVYCKNKESGKFIAGIKFQNFNSDNIRFVSDIVRFYHYQKDTP